MKRLAIVALLILITSFGVGNSQVKADDSAYDWCYLFGGGYGTDALLNIYLPVPGHSLGTYNTSLDRWDGWKASSSSIGLQITIPSGSIFTYAGMTFQRTAAGSAGTSRSFGIINNVSNTTIVGQENSFGGSQSINTSSISTTSLKFFATGYGTVSTPNPGVYITLINLKGTGDDPFGGSASGNRCPNPVGTPEYVRPLTSADESTWGLFDQEGNYGPVTYVASDNPDDYVYSAMRGRVIRLEPLRNDHCRDWVDSETLLPIACDISIPESVNGFGNGTYVYSLGFSAYNLLSIPDEMPNAWIVGILKDNVYFEYWVKDAPDYVELDGWVEAGCYIGKTLPMLGGSLGLGSSGFDPGFSRADQGMAIMLHSEYATPDVFPDLTD